MIILIKNVYFKPYKGVFLNIKKNSLVSAPTQNNFKPYKGVFLNSGEIPVGIEIGLFQTL